MPPTLRHDVGLAARPRSGTRLKWRGTRVRAPKRRRAEYGGMTCRIDEQNTKRDLLG